MPGIWDQLGLPRRDLEPPADEKVACSQCQQKKWPEDMVAVLFGEELFCDEKCLEDWIADNADLLAKRLKA